MFVVVVLLLAMASSVDLEARFPVEDVGTTLDGGFSLFGSRKGKLGIGLVNVGDINGDGLDDLLTGQREYTERSINFGRAIVVFGTDSGLPVMTDDTACGAPYGFCVTTNDSFSRVAYSVGGGGDYNGDGINDILLGCKQYAQSNDGTVAVIWGRNSSSPWPDTILLEELDPSVGILISPEKAGDNLGEEVAHIGDFNDDGVDDFAVTCGSYFTESATQASYPNGRVYVVFGHNGVWQNFTLSSTHQLSIEGAEYSYFGSALASGGDINNDNVTDFIIGSPAYTLTAFTTDDVGQVLVLFGGTHRTAGVFSSEEMIAKSEDEFTGYTLTGTEHFGQLGYHVSGACDVNGDGFDDVIVSHLETDNLPGIALILYGKASGFDVPYNLSNLAKEDGYKYLKSDMYSSVQAIECMGDLDGDGNDELAIGTGAKTVFLIYGESGKEYVHSDMDSLTENYHRHVSYEGAYYVQLLGTFFGTDSTALAFAEGIATVNEVDFAGIVYVMDEFTIPNEITDSPTSSPTVSPTSSPTAPTTSPTTSPTTLPTLFPSSSPTVGPTMSPTTSPTSAPSTWPSTSPTSSPTAPQCEIVVSTTGGDGVSWDVTDDEGDEEIASGEFGAADQAFTLLQAEEYLLFLSTDTIPTGSSITVSVDGEETTIPLDAVTTTDEIAGVTCQAITNKLESVSDSSVSRILSWSVILALILIMI